MDGLVGGLYRPLGEADVVRIHETALRILAEVGVKVELPEALEAFRAHGASVEGCLVRIPAAVVEKAIGAAPAEFLMAGRSEANDLMPGGKRVYLGTGGAALTVLDLDTGRARPGALDDIARIARLVDALANVHFYLRPCIPQDMPKEVMDINQFFAAVANTGKHVMIAAQSAESAREIISAGRLIAGGAEDLVRRPFFSFVTSWMISPLHFATETTRVLMEVVRNRIPVALSSAPMAGSTSPVTLAGTLVQVHAEQLSGIVLAQLTAPGAPVLYGAIPSLANLKTMDYVGGGIEFGLMNGAVSQLSQFIGVPNYNSAGLTESKIPDIQAGYEKAFSICLCALAGSNYVHHAAGMLESMRAVSYEQYVIDDEIIGMALRLLRGIRLDDDALAFDAIREVGPSGHYLSSPHTIRHLRREYYTQTVADRLSREAWENAGARDARERARARAREILETHRPPEIEPSVLGEIRKLHDIRI